MERTTARWIRAKSALDTLLRGLARAVAAAAVLLNATTVIAAAPTSLPSDGSVALLYSKAAGVSGCSQRTEAEVRDLIVGVVHLHPFVAAGSSAPFSLLVDVTRQGSGLVRAAFSLYDKHGGSLGTSMVEDETCDGAHLKLA